MNAQRLGRQLKQELLKNPKKTAVLSLLALVALYFWAPLVWKWVAPESSSPAATPTVTPGQASLSPTVATGAVGAVLPKKKSPGYEWNQLTRWMDQDPRMASATVPEGRQNPFGPSRQELARLQREQEEQQRRLEEQRQKQQEQQQSQAVKPQQQVEITPESVGLELGSTLVGARVRLATISGVTYRESAVVAVGGDGDRGPIEFTLTKIGPRRVVLVRDGHAYPLKLKQPELSSGDRIVLTETSGGNH